MKMKHEVPFLGLYSNQGCIARNSTALSHVQQLCNTDLEQYHNETPLYDKNRADKVVERANT